MTVETPSLAHILETDSGVDPAYRHIPKRVTPGEPLATPGAVFKWYGLYPEDRPIPDEIARLARTYLAAHPLEARGMGFAILHRCGEGFYFLLVSTWRFANEIWESVYYKDGEAMADFAPFPRDGVHKPAFCVWEMVPVWHEQKAWERFLGSARDEAAAQTWLGDRYAGPA
jgi:hypothetical protein